MNTQHDPEDFGDTIDDEEVFAGLRRSVAGATLTTSVADVTALGRRTRNRRRAIAAGIGTSAAALVAAVGVLAPSAGTPAGSTDAGSTTVLKIQDAGFTLQKHADGIVDVTVAEVFDPAKLQAALVKAGIKSDVQRVVVPRGWYGKTPVDCAATPGVYRDEKVMSEGLANLPPGAYSGVGSTKHPGVLFELHLDRFPTADVVSLVQFEYPETGRYTSAVGILTGMPGRCVPVPAGSPQATGSKF